MSFHSTGSCDNMKIHGRMWDMSWRENINKRIKLSIHFDADFEEFKQFTQTSHLYLARPPHHQPTPQASLNIIVPHPRILEITQKP